LEGKTAPPAEMLVKNQPPGHVAYIMKIEVDNILLAGPATATLEDGFLSSLQHRSIRSFLEIPEEIFCFGSCRKRNSRKRKHSRKSRVCPLCNCI
jgi:hypothetical protein